MFFRKDDKKIDDNFLIKVGALLIHTAKIDQNYTDNEEEIIKKTLLELGVKNENLSSTIKAVSYTHLTLPTICSV